MKAKVAKTKIRQKIDAETLAESGGTVGMFGHLWRKGQLEIVPYEGKQIVPNLKLKAR